MKKNLFCVSSLAAVILTPAICLGQIDPANVSSKGKRVKDNLKPNDDDDQQLPQGTWYDSTWIVDTDVSDAANGAAIAGMSLFGHIKDMSLADDFDCPGLDVDIADAVIAGSADADAGGNASMGGNAPAPACDRLILQAVGSGSCTKSNPVRLKWCDTIKVDSCDGFCVTALTNCIWNEKDSCFCHQ